VISLFFRGWLIVSLVAHNTVAISSGDYPRAIVGGYLISLVWWWNARSAAHAKKSWQAGLVYAAGAALGTATGMWAATIGGL